MKDEGCKDASEEVDGQKAGGGSDADSSSSSLCYSGSVRSWKTWKSHGICKWLFPGLEKVMEKKKNPKSFEKSFFYICAFMLVLNS